MTGHFFCVGVPTDLEIKTYGDGTRELAKWKFGYYRFQTFSETSIAVLRTATGRVMCSGEYKEREYNGETYTDANVIAVTVWDKPDKKQRPAHAPVDESDIPF